MNGQIDENILKELQIEGLRLADENEPGWFWKCYNDNDEKVTLWVTDEK